MPDIWNILKLVSKIIVTTRNGLFSDQITYKRNNFKAYFRGLSILKVSKEVFLYNKKPDVLKENGLEEKILSMKAKLNKIEKEGEGYYMVSIQFYQSFAK